MIARIISVTLVCVVLAGCDDGCGGTACIKGSGNVVTQTRSVEPFTAIRLSSIGDLSVEQGAADSVKVEADDNLQEIVTATVKDGTLTLAEKGCHSCSPTKLAFTVTVKDLRKLDLPATGSAAASKLDGPSLTVDLSGTGSLKLSGRIDDLKLSLSGTGSCDARALATRSAKIDLSGTGNVRVNASEALAASDSGTGDIRYLGSPKLTQSKTGTGSIRGDTN